VRVPTPSGPFRLSQHSTGRCGLCDRGRADEGGGCKARRTRTNAISSLRFSGAEARFADFCPCVVRSLGSLVAAAGRRAARKQDP